MRAILKAPSETALEFAAAALTSQVQSAQSGYPISRRDVRYWHKADVQTVLMNVRFEGNNDMTRTLRDVCS